MKVNLGLLYFNMKFCEKLIAHFPVILHGPHRKLWVQKFFVVACVFVAMVMFTEGLTSRGKGRETKHDAKDLLSMPLRWAQVP
jgi:hypothetical protein